VKIMTREKLKNVRKYLQYGKEQGTMKDFEPKNILPLVDSHLALWEKVERLIPLVKRLLDASPFNETEIEQALAKLENKEDAK